MGFHRALRFELPQTPQSCSDIPFHQVGSHNAKRSSHGHAMIVDPWGKVLADCGGVRSDGDAASGVASTENDDAGIVKVAPVDLDKLRKIRREMPIWNHRRHDVYGEILARFHYVKTSAFSQNAVNVNNAAVSASLDDGDAGYRFGSEVILSPDVVFHETRLSFAFVNRKPVLPGHVLIAPRRIVKRMKDVSERLT